MERTSRTFDGFVTRRWHSLAAVVSDGPALRHRGTQRAAPRFAAIVGVLLALSPGLHVEAGDILRGGAPGNPARGHAASGQNPPAATQARANAQDALARTTNAVIAVKAMQDAARKAALAGPNTLGRSGQNLPRVPEGLAPGGLQVAPGVPKNLAAPVAGENTQLWRGARLPRQTVQDGRTNVTIQQTKPQALLNWQTFNIGRKTTLTFQQGAGGSNRNQWIAFNKIQDPTGAPSQILGSIHADGQVYVINQNGIIFGGSSQVNVHTLVASSLPINDNLVTQGLLNNRDAQFLFSALPVPGGSDGTPPFYPTISDRGFSVSGNAATYVLAEPVAVTGANAPVQAPAFRVRAADGSSTPLLAGTDYTLAVDPANQRATATFTASGLTKAGTAIVTATYTPAQVKSGAVIVQRGAVMESPVNADGNGGRLMLVGSEVKNEGRLSAPAGQTILAAGLQVGVAAHAGTDPSLRGLDVFVGATDASSGTATNTGLIEALKGSAVLAGRRVQQAGVIDSSTSVDLNGRIDLLASYGAVANPNFDNSGDGSGGPPFLFQHTGLVTFGPESVTRILPDYASESTVPGLALPQRSQINAEGLAIHFARQALMLAPSGEVSLRAGVYPFRDLNGDRTIFGTDGNAEPNLQAFFSRGSQRFLFTAGQIYFDPWSMINVAGSTDVFVPLAQRIIDVEFRGAELADSPLQREGALRSIPLTIDLRRTGMFNGRFFLGTPLGDAAGLAGLIQRNAAQLTAEGGNVTLQAGGSIVVQGDAVLDVSGGFFQNEGGVVRTTRLLQDGRLVDIANAFPDQHFDGVFTGQFTVDHPKYGVSETFTIPFLTGERFEPGYLQGAAGGRLQMTAPSMALDGEMRGLTVQSPRERFAPPALSSLALRFTAEEVLQIAENAPNFLTASPTPPQISFAETPQQPSAGLFEWAGDAPAPLRADRLASVRLSPELLEEQGFGHLTIDNPDGDITVPAGLRLTAPPRGSVTLTGANLAVRGEISAPGGALNFRARTISPTFAAEFPLVNAGIPVPAPAPALDRGSFTLAAGASLRAAGLVVDDRPGSAAPLRQPLVLDGGNITISAFRATLEPGSEIDVSGGAAADARGRITYGKGGAISVLTGRDPDFPRVIGGTLSLGSTLLGYAGTTGGSLTLQASVFHLGGVSRFAPAVNLQPDFFRTGGFTSYTLTGIGAASPDPRDAPDIYTPGVTIASGTRLAPVAEQWLAIPFLPGASGITLQPLLREAGLRSPVSLSFNALGSDDSFTPAAIEVRGDIVMGAGSEIITDPGARVSFQGQTVTLLGAVRAPGGAITIAGAGGFPLPSTITPTFARATVALGAGALLSTAGAAVTMPDAFGRRLGTLLPGGTITVSGNIIARRGAILDVSGAAALFDLNPSTLTSATPGPEFVPATSGLTSPLFSLRSVPTRVESNGGLIDLQGSEMLFTDATLLGHAGGPMAVGGTLSIFSGRFYPGSARSSADINLVVTQNAATIPAGPQRLGIGQPVLSANGTPLPGMGYFAADWALTGGFSALDLGFRTANNGVAFGGNVEFRGPVSIELPGSLRVGAGGVLQTSAPVRLSAPYVALGQPFLPPVHPDDPPVSVFRALNDLGQSSPFLLAPVFGTGKLTVAADLIEVGHLSLQNIGRASFVADGGDIRGNGTLNLAGDLTLRAAQIYPTTLADFNLFAFDHGGISGSVQIASAGSAAAPLSAGGRLNIFASRVQQGGVLRAPLGMIHLGWDGTDFDLSDADLDPPPNPISGLSVAVPVAKQVVLLGGSLTSTALLEGDRELLVPFGLSPDGSSLIDPRGVDVTVRGLPAAQVSLAGDRVSARPGSVIDIRGGGDLFAYRFVPGPGGSVDILGTASEDWNGAATYAAGDLVRNDGATWSARVRHSGQRPSVSPFWSLVPASFAILPSYQANFAPFAPFNTGDRATALGGDPGYVSTLAVGERISFRGIAGLEDGSYTLLPRRYALLPGAFLITPTQNDPRGTFTLPDGTTFASGFRFNDFNRAATLGAVNTQFEVASSTVVRNRAQYEDYFANGFLGAASRAAGLRRPQRLPQDAGYLAFHGNAALRPDGQVLASAAPPGRGAMIDLSSFADIFVTGGRGTAPPGSGVILQGDILNSWGAESLFIGGLRRRGADTTTLEVRTSALVLNNPGAVLKAPEITLAARETLEIANGSAVVSSGPLTEAADRFVIAGDGALLRVSDDFGATVTRTNLTNSVLPLLTIGAGARIDGTSVTLDSTYGTFIDPAATIKAEALTLSSGQISILLAPPANGVTGSVVTPHLQISGSLLADVQRVQKLTLLSYRTIDVYGAGTFGGPGSLTLLAGGLRGFDQAGGSVTFASQNVLLANPLHVASLPAPAAVSGTFEVEAGTVRLGDFSFSVAGYAKVALNASGAVIGQGVARTVGGTIFNPTLAAAGDLTITTPLITGRRGSVQEITAGGDLILAAAPGRPRARGGLGSTFTFTGGGDVVADTTIALPSGRINLHALTGDVTVGGRLAVAGTTQQFHDLLRYSDAGLVTLSSDAGAVSLLEGSRVSVAASAGGGNAGSLVVSAGQGAFTSSPGAAILGAAGGATSQSGRFLLDAGTLASYGDLTETLNTGGFFEERNLRVRAGDVVIGAAGGPATLARNFTVSTDLGDITVRGTIDASGRTGGKIALVAGGSLTLESGSTLTTHAEIFSTAGRGGDIRLEAGAAVNGVSAPGAEVTLAAGSTLDLGVDAFVAGDYTLAPQNGGPGSSAFYGQFQGTLHLRAARNGVDLNVRPLAGTIAGASSVLVEGYRIYHGRGPNGDQLDPTLRDQMNAENAAYIDAGGAAIATRLLAGSNLTASQLVVAPGVEIINLNGDLQLGTPNNANGTATSLTTADWNLSAFRYGARQAPGVLTLRARGDLIFNNTLSDGFTPATASAANGHSTMWLGQLMNINPLLPTNTQSWSYRLAAGADLSAADYHAVLPVASLAAGKGSLLVGEFYAPIPNNTPAATGFGGLTANTISISGGSAVNQGTRFEVIRTGTGSIDLAAGRDVQLRNQFATIYTAGVRLPLPQTIFETDDFRAPNFPFQLGFHPNQTDVLGAPQQFYGPSLNEEGVVERIAQYSLAGGHLSIHAGANIGRYTMLNGQLVNDSSRQMPTNWLYRRGYVDAATGLTGTMDLNDGVGAIFDVAASTTWWIDYSNFFEGVGTLGGGDVNISAGNDVVNLDAFAPTNARMAGRSQGVNIAPDPSLLLEHGGGNVTIRAGRNIDAGVFYVERGTGLLRAGGEITTNSTRSPSRGFLLPNDPDFRESSSWLPTTLYLGQGSFDVAAAGDVLLGPIVNAFLLPQGNNNKFWYKTFFNTYSPTATVRVSSLGGDVTHRLAVLPASESVSPGSMASPLERWFGTQNILVGGNTPTASFYQPWLRLAERELGPNFSQVFSIMPPRLFSTSLSGDINLVGDLDLFPSPVGTLELAAAGQISGLQKIGATAALTAFSTSTINVSDADPARVPGILNPLAQYSLVRSLALLRGPSSELFLPLVATFSESGSFTGNEGTVAAQQARHAPGLLHAQDAEPVRIYARGGDLTGLTLFTPKAAQLLAQRDIADVALYLQNARGESISIVAAGRDIVPFNENTEPRRLANSAGNIIVDAVNATASGRESNALAGDLQISGPGVLEVLAGRNLDLGFGENLADGRGVGLTSIGPVRNPFLPDIGADLIGLAGVTGSEGRGPAFGLRGSTLDFAAFDASSMSESATADSAYLEKLEPRAQELTAEQLAIVSLETFFRTLRRSGREASAGGDYSAGFAAIDTLFGASAQAEGEVFTRSRDLRTTAQGAISVLAPAGGLTLAADIFGNPLTPPGLVTEAGGAVSVFTEGSVDLGSARIFTLRGGDIIMWSSTGNIAAGIASRTVATAPPTRVVIDTTSATVQTDLGGLATGGGIGVLAAVAGVPPGDVDLIAPVGFVDAGDAGIRVTGNLNIAASAVLNAGNIQVGGSATGVPSAPAVATPNLGALGAASAAAASQNAAANDVSRENRPDQVPEDSPSIITVEVIDFSDGGTI